MRQHYPGVVTRAAWEVAKVVARDRKYWSKSVMALYATRLDGDWLSVLKIHRVTKIYNFHP